MSSYYLAIDIGASSGRHMLGHLENGKIVLEEVHRFENGMIKRGGEYIWDVDRLFAEIKEGMRKCARIGKIPTSVGIDTWGVDFVLLDDNKERVGNVVAYRDDRTRGMDREVYQVLSEDKLYERTGIQKQIFNTIYQLMAIKKKKSGQLKEAKSLLMVPDYFHFLLSGKMATEYTNATTTQLVNPETKDWDAELIEMLGYPRELFQRIIAPGTVLGELTKEVQEEIGYNCKIVVPATHDTGSAVMAVPTQSDETLYISSGTWSLMGMELLKANCSKESREHNFTNEGGYDYRFRYLKNIMGLWMIQSMKKEIGGNLGYGAICELASKSAITSLVDCNAARFLTPVNMTKEIQQACEEVGQQVPRGIGDVAAVIYNSLAQCYAQTMCELENITGRRFKGIHIVGGGANADYLNELTAKAVGIPVYAGPVEATAIGNILAQMLSEGVFLELEEARACVSNSFSIKKYNHLREDNA